MGRWSYACMLISLKMAWRALIVITWLGSGELQLTRYKTPAFIFSVKQNEFFFFLLSFFFLVDSHYAACKGFGGKSSKIYKRITQKLTNNTDS